MTMTENRMLRKNAKSHLKASDFIHMTFYLHLLPNVFVGEAYIVDGGEIGQEIRLDFLNLLGRIGHRRLRTLSLE